MRRFVSLLMALCMAATMLAPAALAETVLPAAGEPAAVEQAPAAEDTAAETPADKPAALDGAALEPAPAADEAPAGEGAAVTGTADGVKNDVTLDSGALTGEEEPDEDAGEVSVEITRGSRDGSQALQSASLAEAADGVELRLRRPHVSAAAAEIGKRPLILSVNEIRSDAV